MRSFNNRNSLKPRARKKQLLVETTGDGLLVYDLDRHNAHSLNRAATAIWKSCDGHRSVEEIASRLDADLSPGARMTVVRQALADFERKRLLENSGFLDERISRRDLVKKIGMGAAVALTLPVVTSIVAPAAAQAVSCRLAGQPCDSTHVCCSGLGLVCKGNPKACG